MSERAISLGARDLAAPASRRRRWPTLLVLALAVLVVAAGPLLPGPYLARANLVWIAIVGAASLNLLTGKAGQVSLGQAAFMAIGAYTAVFANRFLGLNLIGALLLGSAAAGIIGLLIGIPSLRLRGFYLSLTTLALQFAVTFAATQSQDMSGGTAGFELPKPALGPLPIVGDRGWYYLLAVIGIAVLAAFYNLGRTKVGRAWVAIRDRDLAAAIIGVDVARYKLLAFLVSSLVAGMAGVLQAYYLGNVAVETYSLDLAISYIAMIIIGGLGSVAGSVLGALVVTQLPFVIQWVSATLLVPDSSISFAIFDVQAGAFGLVIVAFLIFEPDGLVGIAMRLGGAVARLRRS